MKTARYIEKLERWHINAEVSFRLYQKLIISLAPNKIGEEEASENLKAMQAYDGVFEIFRNNARYTSLMSLAVLFVWGTDKQGEPSMSIPNLLGCLEESGYIRNNDDTATLTGLEQQLRTLKSEEIKILRNQQMAHADKNPSKVGVSDKELREMLNLSRDVFAFAYKVTGGEIHHGYYSPIVDDVDMGIDKLLTDIRAINK